MEGILSNALKRLNNHEKFLWPLIEGMIQVLVKECHQMGRLVLKLKAGNIPQQLRMQQQQQQPESCARASEYTGQIYIHHRNGRHNNNANTNMDLIRKLSDNSSKK